MNGCNNCKFKAGSDCMSPAASFKVFDKDKGVLKVHHSSRSWHRADNEHCPGHEIKTTLLQKLKEVFQ